MTNQEAKVGLNLFKDALNKTGKLQLMKLTPLPGREAFYAVIGSGNKQVDNVLTYEFLSDLPNTPEFQSTLKSYARYTAKRMENVSPLIFYCQSRVPVRVEITWPVKRFPDKDAYFLHVSVDDLRKDSAVALCSIIISGQQEIFDLKQNPFLLEVSTINTIRRMVDGEKLSFFPKGSHPNNLQELILDTQIKSKIKEPNIDSFIAEKIYWLGFKQGDKKTKVWIADEWDADYLGTDTNSLKQTAQILEAQKMIVLDSTGEFASAGENLLIRANEFEDGSALSVNVANSIRDTKSTDQRWDCFIAHASEDKKDFVDPLALELKVKGLKVWYDTFTLEVGDSLRRKIDQGLADSRFGIVILSPHFFAKHWPQQELNGLAARESGGEKVILPVWHEVTREDVCRFSPMLADRLAAETKDGIETVIQELMRVIDKSSNAQNVTRQSPRNDSLSALSPQWMKMNMERLSKSIHFRVRLRPIARRFSENLELKQIDDDWTIAAVGHNKGVEIRNLRTGHFAIVGFDQINEFMTDPSRDRGDLKHGFLKLKVQITLRGIHLEMEPLP